MIRWWLLPVLVLTATVGAAAQGTQSPAAAGSGGASDNTDAAALYEDVLLLTTIRTLQLTGEQLATLAEINSALVTKQNHLEQLRRELWEQYQDDFEAVINAWLTGQRVDGRSKRAADNAVNKLRVAANGLAEARGAGARQLLNVLSEEQRALVEDAATAAERQARTQRMGGIESVGEFVAAELDAIRDLMPDEYQMLAAAEAERIATAIVGPDSPRLEAMTAQVLNILNQVRSWTPPYYQQQRESLPDQIESALGMQTEKRPVAWNDIVRLVSSERTAVVIALIQDQSGGGEE